MSHTKRSNPDPTITDVNDPRYTALNSLHTRMQTIGLIGDAGGFSGGLEHLIGQGVLRTIDGTNDIEPGDLVSYGNRKGMIKEVVRNVDGETPGDGLGDNSIKNFTVVEQMDYLNAVQRADPSANGYSSADTKEVVYVVNDTDDSGVPVSFVHEATGDKIVTGSILVYRIGSSNIIDKIEQFGSIAPR